MAYTDIDDPTAYFQTKTYTGNGATSHAITFDGNSDLQPDFLWQKQRGGATDHNLSNSVIGATQGLSSNTNESEQDNGTGYIRSFQSDGFTLGNSDKVNANSSTNVAWGWKETATAGFDIVSYSGSAASSKTISHSLSAVPKMIIVKCRSADENWAVYHHALGNTHALFLNTTGASSDTPVFADTTPTSSVFSVNADDRTGADGKTYVAYVFAEKQGFSKFGSYTGNGNADGTFVYTGFKPAFIMTKQTDGADWWVMNDPKRDTFNASTLGIRPNDSATESSDNAWTKDILSNGFKHRTTNSGSNGSGNSYIYMAFAENPFVTSTGVPATAR